MLGNVQTRIAALEEDNRRLRIKHDSIRSAAQFADDSPLRRDVLFLLDVPLDRDPADKPEEARMLYSQK